MEIGDNIKCEIDSFLSYLSHIVNLVNVYETEVIEKIKEKNKIAIFKVEKVTRKKRRRNSIKEDKNCLIDDKIINQYDEAINELIQTDLYIKKNSHIFNKVKCLYK